MDNLRVFSEDVPDPRMRRHCPEPTSWHHSILPAPADVQHDPLERHNSQHVANQVRQQRYRHEDGPRLGDSPHEETAHHRKSLELRESPEELPPHQGLQLLVGHGVPLQEEPIEHVEERHPMERAPIVRRMDETPQCHCCLVRLYGAVLRECACGVAPLGFPWEDPVVPCQHGVQWQATATAMKLRTRPVERIRHRICPAPRIVMGVNVLAVAGDHRQRSKYMTCRALNATSIVVQIWHALRPKISLEISSAQR
mmetsp:Transcript_89331/g.251491  ORF Transcript_89331/g.251491 Transcript_89331/m.251491 type:complete len:254 (-) Transcript_89331:239-1000(-)